MSLLVCLDPGKMTGGAIVNRQSLAFESWEVPSVEAIDWLDRLLAESLRVVTVCERFVITSGTLKVGRTDENWPIETIGACRWLVHRYADREHSFEFQGAGDAKKLATDTRLKEAGWHKPGKGHANDAARHAILWLARRQPQDLKKLLDT